LNSSLQSLVATQPQPWIRSLSHLAVQFFWWCFAATLALMSWNALWRLGGTYIRDFDEGRYGVAASEMLHANSALVTTYAGATEFWNLKPPLGYWFLELSYWLGGESPLTLRLPAAICALAATALTMLLVRRIAGSRAAILSGLVLATSFGFLGHHGARSGELDAPLTLLLLPLPVLAPRMLDERGARLAAGLVLGVGFLLKSFAIVPFVAAIAVYGWISRGVRSWRMWPLPLAITAIMAATWAVARSVSEGSWEFVRRMFTEDLLLRSTTEIDIGGSSPWDYVGCLFDRLAPWPLVVLAAFVLSRHFAKRWLSSDIATLLWCYALIPLAIFTIARTHHSWYIIPTYPAWAVLSAVAALELIECAQRVELDSVVSAMLVIGILSCEARLVAHIETHRMTAAQDFLMSLRDRRRDVGPELRTAFTPSYAERFLLQAVDGFKLLDGESVPESRVDCWGRNWVLLRKSTDGWLEAPPGAGELAIIAQSESYALARVRSGGRR